MSELILSRPKECEKLDALRGEIDQICVLALQQKVLDVTTKDAALEIGGAVKRMRKALDDRRREITDPENDKIKQVIAFAKALDAPLERAENHIRAQATSYAQAIAEKHRVEQAKLIAEKQKIEAEKQAQLKAAAAMSETIQEQIDTSQKIEEDAKQRRIDTSIKEKELKAEGVKGTKQEWNFEITQPELVPREFMEINLTAIRTAVKSLKIREIPGVRIFQETRVSLGRY